MFDVEDNRFLRWAELQRRVSLGQMPSRDVADIFLLIVIRAEVGVFGGEVTNAGVRLTRLVTG